MLMTSSLSRPTRSGKKKKVAKPVRESLKTMADGLKLEATAGNSVLPYPSEGPVPVREVEFAKELAEEDEGAAAAPADDAMNVDDGGAAAAADVDPAVVSAAGTVSPQPGSGSTSPPPAGFTFPTESVFAAKDEFKLPYNLWWESANGILDRKKEEVDFNKVRASFGLEAKASDCVDVCSCDKGGDCSEACLNRSMFIECWPTNCPCRKKCTNRQ